MMSSRCAVTFLSATRRSKQALGVIPAETLSTFLVPTDNQCHGQSRHSIHTRTAASPAVRRLISRMKKEASLKSMSSTVAASAAQSKDTKTPGHVHPIKDQRGAEPGSGGPSMEMAKSMPLSCSEMDNTSLLTLAALDVVDARAEVLRRHIMSVDNIPYEEACAKFDEIREFNKSGMLKHTVPYKIGITSAVVGGFVSIPMCFDLNTVMWFNEAYVTADVPEPKDLETWLEVGSWAWNWMEPPLGQMSFFLLCMQFARAQLENLGIRPYTAKIKSMRAARLVKKYPDYDPNILEDYSLCVSYY